MASVIVCGATGAIGREFVRECVAADDTAIASVTALSRTTLDTTAADTTVLTAKFPGIDVVKAAAKLRVVAVDWEDLCQDTTDSSKWKGIFGGHDFAVCALGTTRKDAGSATAFRHVDFDFVSAFAIASGHFSKSTLRHFQQVSSTGADSSSYFLYMQTKGQADDFVVAQKFPITSIYKPGLLGRKDKARFVEKFASWFTTAMPVETVGRAMLKELLGGKLAKATTTEPQQQQDDTSSKPIVRTYTNAQMIALSKL